MLIIRNIKLNINEKEDILLTKISKKLNIKTQDIIDYKIDKRSLDSRTKDNIHYVYSIIFNTKNNSTLLKKYPKIVSEYKKNIYKYEKSNNKEKICVIGYGPAGIFATYALSKSNVEVDVYERGEDVDERSKSIDNFIKNKVLNTNSNIQFGEGGAGTYSDGKLTSRTKDPRITEVFNILIDNGAPKEIDYVHNPHIGTDILRNVVKNIRKKSIELGANIHFNSLVEDFIIEDNTFKGIIVNNERKYYDKCILAIGHSARETIKTLHKHNLKMEIKPTAVGFRIEHLQKDINKMQYGDPTLSKRLGPAEYKLTYNTEDKRGIYSFCMCPGGVVVPAQSEENTVVVNGMSYHARDKENANSAIVCTINQNDFNGDVLDILNFQEKIESEAFILGGSDYKAPVQLVKDYINNVETTSLNGVIPSYEIGYKLTNLRNIYPDYINEAIIYGLNGINKKAKNFISDDSILTGVETRTSSPVRITRDRETLESSVSNLYPCGEGGGHAGGIVSAAIDGLKIYEKVIK